MGASFSAELLKLRKRPATWVIGLIFIIAVALFGYLFTYLFVVNAPAGGGPQQEQFTQQALQSLLPENMLVNMLSNFANFGSALALVLGALAVGSEYGWDTYKVAMTQRPGRLELFAGKLAALAVILAALTLVIFAAGALASYTIAVLEEESASWPGILEILEGLGAGWLILTTFAAMGLFFATLFRGTALAIALGLVYLLVLENLFLSLAQQSETVESIGRALPYKNSADLIEIFGEVPAFLGGGAFGEAVEPARAIITLVIYTLVFVALAVLLIRSRDVT